MFDIAEPLPGPGVQAPPIAETPVRGRLLSIGSRRLHIVEAGPANRPAVIFEAGPFGLAADWAVVQAGVAQRRRTLAYDRAGLGVSDPGPEPRSSAAIVDDLQALLAAANLRGPYVLVAQGVAAFHAQRFALRRPEAVCGLVLVDPVTPEAMDDKRVSERVKGSEWFAGLALVAQRLGLLRMAEPLAAEPIGLPAEAAADKRQAFHSERHNHWSAAEAREWAADAADARLAGDLSRELAVAVISIGAGDPAVRELTQAPARRSRRGYVEHVAAANASTILGPRHGEAVVRGVQHVMRFAHIG